MATTILVMMSWGTLLIISNVAGRLQMRIVVMILMLVLIVVHVSILVIH